MIAIIPARGGSKGLPGKNIRPLCGKPLLAWVIESALAANNIDEVIITTDSPEIADVASSFGAKVPFMRPPELATDSSIADDAYIYTVDRLNEEYGYSINNLCVLLPTNPLTSPEDIDGAINLFKKKKAEAVIGVCELAHPAEWVKKMDDEGVLKSLSKDFDEACNFNRQALGHSYIPNGSIFVLKYSKLLTRDFYGSETFGYVMPRKRSADIDTLEDFEYAEFLINKHIKD